MIRRLIDLSLHHRGLTLALALAMCVYGVFAAARLPVDVLPDLNRPTVAILTEAPGLSPEEVELRVTTPIEAAINGAPGLERLRSTSSLGLSIVHAEFAWGGDVRFNRIAVQERLAQARNALPEGVTPHLGPVSSIMGEIMLMGVTGDGLSPIELRDQAEWVLRPAILSIPGIAQVTVQGGQVRQFQVRANPERLRLYELTLDELRDAVADANRNATGGYLVEHGSEFVVRTLGQARQASDIENALVATRTAEGHAIPVRVRDVARVVEQAPASFQRGVAAVYGTTAVVLAISKQPGADTRALTAEIERKIESMRPTLPAGLTLHTDLFRQSVFIDRAIENVVAALRDGSILVIIILALFLLNLRPTAITLTAIPLSLLATFIIFRMMGQSINTMTLGGMAVAIGELVDDAVVGVENVFRRLREAGPARLRPADALRIVRDATQEVRSPILIGTAIVLLTFLPLLALPGLPGRLFSPLATAYILSILSSMVVSLTVTPALCHLLLPGMKRASSGGDGPVLRACKRAAARAYALSLPRPWTVVALCAAAVALAGVTVTRLGAEFLPPFNEGTATVSINATPGISLEESNRLGRMAETLLLSIPEVKSAGRRVGRAEEDEHAIGVNSNEIEVTFFARGEAPAHGRTPPERTRAREAVFAEIREKLALLPGVTVGVGQPISHRIEHLQSGVEAQVVLKIFGPELGTLRAVAEEARALIEPIGGVADLAVEQQMLVPEVHLRIDPERAARAGFTVGRVAETLETALRGTTVSRLVEGLRSYALVVMLDDPWRTRLDTLADLRLLAPSGAIALVRDVAEIRELPRPNTINRENAQRRILVYCNVEGRDLGSTVEEIERTIADRLRLPEGYTIRFEGQHETQRRATSMILVLGGLSLAVMFALLRGSFGSAVIAAQVMLNIPFAFIGAVAALLVTGQPFSVASLVGFISLCGIAARNGVLMISHYLHLLKHENLPFGRELIIRGSQERVAPVLMTALTTGLGLIPLAVASGEPGKEILYPVSVVMLGGLVTCTILDFFVTPTVFLRFGRAASLRLLDEHRGQIRENPS